MNVDPAILERVKLHVDRQRLLETAKALIEVPSPTGSADRYTYVPYIGLFAIGAWGLGECVAARPAWRISASSAASAILLACVSAFAPRSAETRSQKA